MTRSQSISVLNEADSMERRLDWVLFQQDNNAVVYGDGSGWQPGDFLYDTPRYDLWAGVMITPGGQYVRPMIQEIDIDYFHVGVPDEGWPFWECHDCEVKWATPENEKDFSEEAVWRHCWLCGELRIPKPPPIEHLNPRGYPTGVDRATLLVEGWGEPLRIYNRTPVGRVTDVETAEDGSIIARGELEGPLVSYSAADAEATAQVLRDFGQATVRATNSMRDWMRSAMVELLNVEWRAFQDEWIQEALWGDGRELSVDWSPRPSYLIHPRRQGLSGLRAMFGWLDEASQPEPLSTHIDVEVDGISLNIPRVFPTQAELPTPNYDMEEGVRQLVDKHRAENPQYYRTSRAAHERRDA